MLYHRPERLISLQRVNDGVPQAAAILLTVRKTNLSEASPSSREHPGAELVNLETAAREHLGFTLALRLQ